MCDKVAFHAEYYVYAIMVRLQSVLWTLSIIIIVQILVTKIIKLEILVHQKDEQLRGLQKAAEEIIFQTESFDGKTKCLYLLHFEYSMLDKQLCSLAKSNHFDMPTKLNCDNLVQSPSETLNLKTGFPFTERRLILA